jgi:hypothetical protein
MGDVLVIVYLGSFSVAGRNILPSQKLKPTSHFTPYLALRDGGVP